MTVQTWQDKVAAKKEQASSNIPSEWRVPESILAETAANPSANILNVPRESGILSPREIEITESTDATALLEQLSAGKYTSVEVATAFCKRAAIAQQLTSCLTETFFDVALARAKELDDHFAKTGKTTGPLHGLPISLKDCFNVTGVPTTIGFVSFLDKPPHTTNTALVDILLKAGAVLYVKTNLPQTMMTADSHNNIFGRTLNPNHLNLTAGGSSGGEGALIALRGSLLGVGTDIGGSIRIPALCCGLIGFKPSSGRIPYAGMANPVRDGLTGIAPVAGPLCHSVRDADLFMDVVSQLKPEDVDDQVHGIPWTRPTPKDTLTIGLLREAPERPWHPSIHRALARAVNRLARAGHTIVDLRDKPPSIKEASELAFQFFSMDTDNSTMGYIAASGEPPIPSLEATYGKPPADPPQPTLRGLYEANVAKADYEARMRKMFIDNDLDIIISSGYQSPAPPHDTFGLPFYTVIWNLVDYPSCIIPFEKANEAEDAVFVRDVEYIPPYTPEEIEGAPCHVQIIGRRTKDETLVQNAKIVESILRA
ncbi:amidase signature domain-containing protein [Aspergillus avenaceus]|uniref:amidase n=1 Tax=Aspergillus avenaceus TaxID=36643 RepID=A0A5N6U955_ASPAV|nr:amidase signature domain-containing protein [Aspergillus avenaceus]